MIRLKDSVIYTKLKENLNRIIIKMVIVPNIDNRDVIEMVKKIERIQSTEPAAILEVSEMDELWYLT